MKHYDYKDETKDVRGKVSISAGIRIAKQIYNTIILDRETQCYQ